MNWWSLIFITVKMSDAYLNAYSAESCQLAIADWPVITTVLKTYIFCFLSWTPYMVPIQNTADLYDEQEQPFLSSSVPSMLRQTEIISICLIHILQIHTRSM